MPEIGQTLSHFKIVEKIGQGGMGEVYLADDTTLDRKVALKFLPEAFTSDPERMARFEREAKLLASLNHSNIAGIYGLEQADGNRFLVLEYVKGETLQARLSKGALPLEDALALCRQIAEGLEAAHEKGVIHRDLKPANVMITAEEKLKILDFGLAKALSDDTQSIDSSQSPTLTEAMTRPGVILGTAAYMSPEQAKGKSVDKRADIWAFGCILYECLTGKKAFEGETVTETLAAVIRGEPDWNALPTTTPQNIQFVLRRCLEKERNRRLRDAADVQIEIEERINIDGTSAPIKKQNPWLWKSIAGVFIIAFLGISFFHFYSKRIIQVNSAKIQIALPYSPVLPINRSFKLSPDGRHLAFIKRTSGGNFQIRIRALDSLESEPISGSEAVWISSLFWSPDNRYLAYCEQEKLRKVNVAKGQPETICDISGWIERGSWNRDGMIIFSSDKSDGIMQVPAAKGNPSPLTKLNSDRQETAHMFPAFLSDGRHFLYFCESNAPEIEGVYVGSLDSQPEEQSSDRLLAISSTFEYVPSQDSNPGQLLYLNQQNLMAQAFDEKRLEPVGKPLLLAEQVDSFSVSIEDTLAYSIEQSRVEGIASEELVWIDREGKKLESAAPPGQYNDFRLSKDDRRIVFDLSDPGSNPDIWVRDLIRGVSSRLTFDPEADNLPIWSYDGLRVLFPSRRDGPFNLYVKAASGAGQVELLVKLGTSTGWGTDWSRDGRFILYQIPGEETGQDLWIAPQIEDQESYPYLNEFYDEQEGTFSPDHKWIAYVSNETGRNEIYVQSFPPSGTKSQVSNGGGSEPYWSEDGTELFYLSADRNLISVPTKLSPIFDPGQARSLISIPLVTGRHSYAVSRDGKRFLVANQTGEGNILPITVIVNWQADLKQ